MARDSVAASYPSAASHTAPSARTEAAAAPSIRVSPRRSIAGRRTPSTAPPACRGKPGNDSGWAHSACQAQVAVMEGRWAWQAGGGNGGRRRFEARASAMEVPWTGGGRTGLSRGGKSRQRWEHCLPVTLLHFHHPSQPWRHRDGQPWPPSLHNLNRTPSPAGEDAQRRQRHCHAPQTNGVGAIAMRPVWGAAKQGWTAAAATLPRWKRLDRRTAPRPPLQLHQNTDQPSCTSRPEARLKLPARDPVTEGGRRPGQGTTIGRGSASFAGEEEVETADASAAILAAALLGCLAAAPAATMPCADSVCRG